MKKLLIVLIIGILVPIASSYAQKIELDKCDFIEKDVNLVKNIIMKGAIYKDKNTNGMLCLDNKDNISINIPINNGLAHGVINSYYENGNLSTTFNFKNGKPHGIVRVYSENGELESESNFQNGILHGSQKEYYEKEQLKSEKNYLNGKKNGIQIHYYKNGKKENESKVVNGKILYEKYFEESGSLVIYNVYTYKDINEYIKKKIYNFNGKLFATVEIVNGKVVSGECANGRKWNEAEIENWENGATVICE